ncbi:MAG: hypothetical protein NTW90_07730 [Nitrosospira sp.]|nr:hypothetical protein [Nitrosospira sp.]
MFDTSNLPQPKKSNYGWSLVDRREEFRKLLEKPTGETHRVADFKGETVSLPILRIPINLPKYRISNGRTASAQQEYVALHPTQAQASIFDGDPEIEDVQIAQHHILQGMVKDEGLAAKFKDSTNKQVEPILLDENGFVVNGNRRLCCWRTLYEGNKESYGHFGHIDVVVLPHCDEKELDRLEAKLQIERDIRSDYSWDSEANMMAQKQRLHNLTTLELAQNYGKTKKNIEDMLAMLAIAGEYLESRQRKNEWSVVKDDRYAFEELQKAIAATSSAGDKELIKEAAFALIDDSGQVGERLYSAIPKVKEHLAAVKESLSEAFPLPAPKKDEAAENAFGGGQKAPVAAVKRSEFALVAAIKKDAASVKKAREVIIEAIRTQDEQANERNRTDFLFKTIKKANQLIQNAAGHGLKPESSVSGVESQLENLKAGIALIEKWLAEKKPEAKG